MSILPVIRSSRFLHHCKSYKYKLITKTLKKLNPPSKFASSTELYRDRRENLGLSFNTWRVIVVS